MNPRLAKYELRGKLGSGGMADVWLARATGPEGFQKLVVLKTIMAERAENPRFAAMFLNEARVAAMLNHPNCVQVFDFGVDNGTYYIAMELIEGFSLSRLLPRMWRNEGQVVPVLVRIGMDAASGLDHAHRLCDSDGRPIGLVHRDVSPDNMLVSFSGQTKLVDFGIAKAASPGTDALTRTGDVKGKTGYMAPEQLRGEPIDARADLFALGVVLYRALTGAKPFQGPTEAMVAQAVLDPAPPPAPRTLNPAIPPPLESVILRALEKDAAKRFDSARAMRAALDAAVQRAASPEEVGAFMESLWPPGDPERQTLQELAQGKPRSLSEPAFGDPVGQGTGHTTAERAEPVASGVTRKKRRQRPRRTILVASSVAMVIAGACLVAWRLTAARSRPEPARATESRAAIPSPLAEVASRTIEDAPRGPAIPAAAEPAKTAEASGPARVNAGPPPSVHRSPKNPRPAAVGRVELDVQPSVDVLWRGKLLGRAPGTFDLPVGRQVLRLSDEKLGLERRLTVAVAPDRVTRAQVLFKKASLDIRCAPWAEVKLDGRSLGATPIPVQEVYEGRHVVELSNSDLAKTKRVTVSVGAGEQRVLYESFDESPPRGAHRP